MKVIVDTVIWSLALRRSNPQDDVCQELTSLIEEQRVILLGPIRQEVLSGYSEEKSFERLQSHLLKNDTFIPEQVHFMRLAEVFQSLNSLNA